ncbi:glycosyltransferase family 4 protein [Proteiniphilum acetatigenes]|uniref:glycosyltransferase family 4 protein n=1 Tax=Proteiniphilum acetatigenes TaxID=294710 RepID=UPI001C86A4DD|nr:glycosyltransferase family 4 protein [Proteiniphilum acetatigenes]
MITTTDWFLISHRLVIAKAAVNAGWNVYVACEDTGRGDEIAVNGITFIPFSFSRSGTNVFSEYMSFKQFEKLYKSIRPDVVHLITLKPVVYGSIAAKQLRIPKVVNAISGMGYVFTNKRSGLVQKIILRLMKFGFDSPSVSLIIQNNDDKNELIKNNVLNEKLKTFLIKGSGIELDWFPFSPLPEGGKINILLPCRMLWDKGVRELKEASDLLKEKYKGKIQFVLLGMVDKENKASVPESYLKEWEEDDYVVWEGYHPNVLDYYHACHIVVLPSYREGLPKTLIEACAVGRPIVTTDAIGCRDCVDEGVNGFKVPVRDSIALAKSLETLINNRQLMEEMGKAGRKKAEAEFDVNEVIRKHLDIYRTL